MSQTTGNPRGSNTSISGSTQRTNTTTVTNQGQNFAGQRDVTAKFQPSTKSTQNQPNQRQQGQWEKKAGGIGSSTTTQGTNRGKDEGKSSYYTSSKK